MHDGIARVPARSLSELKKNLDSGSLQASESLLQALEQDARRGAQQLAASIRQRRQREIREEARLERLRRFEKELQEQGFRQIAGVDEAGMAPLAGPVVAAAVILPPGYGLKGLNDSKKIPDAARRAELADAIKRGAVGWAVGRTEVEEIDRLNIYRAGLLAMLRAVQGLAAPPDFVLVDARRIPDCPYPQKGIIHGDALSASIAAASIIAKTTRDQYMTQMDALYPGYGFAAHKGYPTPEHLAALQTLGPCRIHRQTFAPVRARLGKDPQQTALFPPQ